MGGGGKEREERRVRREGNLLPVTSEVSLSRTVVLGLTGGGWVGGFARLGWSWMHLPGQRVRHGWVPDGSSGSPGLSLPPT